MNHYHRAYSGESYLYHHGIRGQKWGVRNGPPYPLGSGAHSASERKAGWRNSLRSTGTHRSGSAFRNSSQSQVERYRLRYGVVGDSGSAKSVVGSDARAVAKKYGFQVKPSPTTVSQDIKSVNPDWYDHQDDKRWLVNCTHSAVTFAARRRGLDVIATPMTKKQGEQGGETLFTTCNRYFKGGFDSTEDMRKNRDFKEVKMLGGLSRATGLGVSGSSLEHRASDGMGKIYQDAPDGAYGITYVSLYSGGHVFSWYKEDGQIKFADPQSGLTGRSVFDNIARYGGYPRIVSARLDNRELNPDTIGECITAAPVQHSAISASERYYAMAQRSIGGGAVMNELYHYGILGQKWGVRRFQNSDGSLTSAGRERYGRGASHKTTRFGKTRAQRESEAQKRYDMKNRGTLTTEQLQRRIQRLQMEKQLRELTESEINPGRKAVKDVLRKVGTTVATGALLYGVKAAVSRKGNAQELGEAMFNGGPKKKK